MTKRVKQGCVQELFNMIFSAILTGAFQDRDNGTSTIHRYRFDVKRFDVSLLQAISKVHEY